MPAALIKVDFACKTASFPVDEPATQKNNVLALVIPSSSTALNPAISPIDANAAATAMRSLG